MNATPPSIPSLKSLYWRDFTIRRAANVAGFMLIAAFGIRWVSQPMPNAVVKVELSPPEEFVMKWGFPIGLALVALAVLVLMWRYQWLKQALSRGTAIKGVVDDVDVYATENKHSDTTPAFQRSYTRSYYARIRYTMRGVERKVRLKLPNSAGTYKIAKGGDVDLLVLESAPGRPLIREVYLGRW
jgi:hypothetical protein